MNNGESQQYNCSAITLNAGEAFELGKKSVEKEIMKLYLIGNVRDYGIYYIVMANNENDAKNKLKALLDKNFDQETLIQVLTVLRALSCSASAGL